MEFSKLKGKSYDENKEIVYKQWDRVFKKLGVLHLKISKGGESSKRETKKRLMKYLVVRDAYEAIHDMRHEWNLLYPELLFPELLNQEAFDKEWKYVFDTLERAYRKIMTDNPDYLKDTDNIISEDEMGFDDVITTPMISPQKVPLMDPIGGAKPKSRIFSPLLHKIRSMATSQTTVTETTVTPLLTHQQQLQPETNFWPSAATATQPVVTQAGDLLFLNTQPMVTQARMPQPSAYVQTVSSSWPLGFIDVQINAPDFSVMQPTCQTPYSANYSAQNDVIRATSGQHHDRRQYNTSRRKETLCR